jgi:uncharacterized membrane protein
MLAILGAGAMGVDLGFTVYGSRQAQAIADTAAADVIQYIATADLNTSNTNLQTYLNTQLAAVLKDNNSDATLTVTPMLYQNGTYIVPALGCAAPFPPNPLVPICNAVAVNATQTVPQPFWGGFNSLAGHGGSAIPVGSGCGSNSTGGCGMGCPGFTPCFSCPTGGCTTCPTTACYQLQPQGCFSIGTYLASYSSQQTAVLNAIMGQLGSSVNITAVGYQGLANTYVTVAQLLTAGGQYLSPADVMTTSLSVGTWASLFLDALNNQQQSGMCSTGTTEQANAEAALALMGSGGPQLELCQLISINGLTCQTAQNDQTAALPQITYAQLSTGINLLQAMTTAAELSNGSNGISVNLTSALGVGVTVGLNLVVSAPPQIAYGPVGSVTTPASGCPPSTGTATCATTAQVAATFTVNVAGQSAISIPFNAAMGTATLNNIACAWTPPFTSLEAMTQTATAAVTVGSAPLVTLSISGAGPKAFSYSTGASGVVPPTAATASAGSNPKQLVTTNPSVTASNPQALWSVLSPVLAPLEDVLVPVLQAAGITVGNADVADLGLDCDAIVPGP